MHRRLNITLPEETIKLIDQVAEKGDAEYVTLLFERLRQRDRSRLINEAVQYYIEQKALADLREQLKEGAICRVERDLGLVNF
ncbi:hypothetical protein H6G81_27525 [Scytonema hofmannii FACHB-248]|uniref:CopG family transcriptional regulator n=1 Tax=Scytonema hofmannii FACHB-248 TaxID=1842502 RepID=A0ABR8GY16_9CYAN|nr:MULTISPECIES: hypothetical protein [Nostocales]MBD2608164.1 hypothetical protein [Scytonema hofmannii FACHB-248]